MPFVDKTSAIPGATFPQGTWIGTPKITIGEPYVGSPPPPVPQPPSGPIEAMLQFQNQMLQFCEDYNSRRNEYAEQAKEYAELYHQATTACDAVSKVLASYRAVPAEKAAY